MQASNPTILCVDDDTDILESLSMLLRSGGYGYATAQTAEEALQKLEETEPAAVLVDLMMEEIDTGTTLVKEFRSRGYQGPIVMLSSVGDSLNLSTDYNELGLAGVLQKPVSRETLLRLLKDKIAN